MAGREARAQIAQIAADQWGLITTSQAAAVGVSKVLLSRMASSGELERVTHGVYATPAAATDELLETKALWLTLDPARPAYERLEDLPTSGVLSHATAAALHGIGDLLDDRVEVTLPRRHRSRRPELRTHRGELEPYEVTRVDGLPVTTAARTVVDLVTIGNDRDHVATILREALRRGLATPRDVRDALVRHLGKERGVEVLDELVTAAGLDEASAEAAIADSDVVRRVAGELAARSLANAQLSLLSPDLMKRIAPDWNPAEGLVNLAGGLDAFKLRAADIIDTAGVGDAFAAVRAMLPALEAAGVGNALAAVRASVQPALEAARAADWAVSGESAKAWAVVEQAENVKALDLVRNSVRDRSDEEQEEHQ